MLDLKLIRQETHAVRDALSKRGGRALPLLEEILTMDTGLRAVMAEIEPLRARRNQASDEMGRRMREKKGPAGRTGEASH